MRKIVVVNNLEDWGFNNIEEVEVVAAKTYLTDLSFMEIRNARVFNLCRSYAYQSTGYYVSLLAEARGHKPTPDVVTIQDMKSASLVRVITDDLDHLIQKTLRPIKTDEFSLSIYFGQTVAKRDQGLGVKLFGFFRAPLMRAVFTRKKDRWSLQSIRPISTSDIPENHRQTVLQSAMEYFSKRQWTQGASKPPRYH